MPWMVIVESQHILLTTTGNYDFSFWTYVQCHSLIQEKLSKACLWCIDTYTTINSAWDWKAVSFSELPFVGLVAVISGQCTTKFWKARVPGSIPSGGVTVHRVRPKPWVRGNPQNLGWRFATNLTFQASAPGMPDSLGNVPRGSHCSEWGLTI